MGKVLSPQGSGYFPGCIEPYGGYFSLSDAMKIYWRVKSWTISGEYVYGPYSYDFSQTFTSTLSEEAHLVCLANNLNTDFSPDTGDGTFFQRPYSFSWNESSLFYPDLIWSVSFPDPAGPDQRSVGTQLSEFNEATYTILGYTMPCGVFKKDDDEYVSEAINVTAVPASYWSYGGTYDTATGNPL